MVALESLLKMHKILKCLGCDTYTIKENCPKCNNKTTNPKPARYKSEDKYSKYRRQYKEEMKNAMDS